MGGPALDICRIITHAVVDYPAQAAVLEVKELDRDGAGPGTFFLLCQDEPMGQGLAVHVFRHGYLQAPAEDVLSPF
jgi:hypothetical protein